MPSELGAEAAAALTNQVFKSLRLQGFVTHVEARSSPCIVVDNMEV